MRQNGLNGKNDKGRGWVEKRPEKAIRWNKKTSLESGEKRDRQGHKHAKRGMVRKKNTDRCTDTRGLNRKKDKVVKKT